MSLNISTTSDITPQELTTAFAEKGVELTPVTASVAVEESPAVAPVVEKPSETPGEPGAPVAVEPVVESSPATEEGKTQAQEPPPGEEPKEKPKGGWQRKVEKLTSQLSDKDDEIQRTRGDKAKLQAEADELRAKLAELTGAGAPAAEPDKKAEAPVKPKRPTLAECDGDYDKYELAMEEYDGKLTEYHQKVAEHTVDQRLADQAKVAAEAEKQADYTKRMNAFAERKDKGKSEFDDWQEIVDAVEPIEKETGKLSAMSRSQIAHDYILFKAKEPAALLYILGKDMVENDGELNDRLSEMDGFDITLELKAMEDAHAAKRGKSKIAAVPSPAPVAPTESAPPAAAVPPAPPVQTRPQSQPPTPIRPLGSRGNGPTSSETLESVVQRGGSVAEYIKLRNAGVKA
jgi:hypothetical protein